VCLYSTVFYLLLFHSLFIMFGGGLFYLLSDSLFTFIVVSHPFSSVYCVTVSTISFSSFAYLICTHSSFLSLFPQSLFLLSVTVFIKILFHQSLHLLSSRMSLCAASHSVAYVNTVLMHTSHVALLRLSFGSFYLFIRPIICFGSSCFVSTLFFTFYLSQVFVQFLHQAGI